MKIIDLLNKIANGEEVPKKFIIKGSCFKDLYFEYNEKYNCYDLIGEKFKNGCYVFGYSELNDEIEIIEDTLEEEKKIPEKIKDYSVMKTMGLDCEFQERKISKDFTLEEIVYKINEIIDCLDYLKSKGDE